MNLKIELRVEPKVKESVEPTIKYLEIENAEVVVPYLSKPFREFLLSNSYIGQSEQPELVYYLACFFFPKEPLTADYDLFTLVPVEVAISGCDFRTLSAIASGEFEPGLSRLYDLDLDLFTHQYEC
ncbi:MAG: hypothetical protein ABEK59_07475, partial [Halobacteria archaeon]